MVQSTVLVLANNRAGQMWETLVGIFESVRIGGGPMSLDVFLYIPNAHVHPAGTGIFVREKGQQREISRAEWDERFPGVEPVVVQDRDSLEDSCVFRRNITHNLNRMADAAGIYMLLWHPDELGISKARDLIEALRLGLATLKADAARFELLNPSNGWGNYDSLLSFVEAYLAACERYPDADVRVSR